MRGLSFAVLILPDCWTLTPYGKRLFTLQRFECFYYSFVICFKLGVHILPSSVLNYLLITYTPNKAITLYLYASFLYFAGKKNWNNNSGTKAVNFFYQNSGVIVIINNFQLSVTGNLREHPA